MEYGCYSIAIYIGYNVNKCSNKDLCGTDYYLVYLDYAYQWWEYEKNLKMSKQEIKEEYKQTEGNPEIKSKIKQKQRQMSMRRMMQEYLKQM